MIGGVLPHQSGVRHLHVNRPLESLIDEKALNVLRFFFILTFFTSIWSSVDSYQEMTTLLIFNSFRRVFLGFQPNSWQWITFY